MLARSGSASGMRAASIEPSSPRTPRSPSGLKELKEVRVVGASPTPKDGGSISAEMRRKDSVLDNINASRRKADFRSRVRMFLDDTKSSKSALYFAIGMTIAILVSVLSFCLATVPKYENMGIFGISEWVFNSIFSLEFLTRILVAKTCGQVFLDAYLWFDFLAIMPFWLEISLGGETSGGLAILDLVKAMRMLRLMKLARQYDNSIILFKAIRASRAALGVPFFFLFVAMCLFASVIFFSEKIADEDNKAFDSVPHAMWFMVVTMTTVGYGDVSPNTTIGKFITTAAMIFGVLFLSMPLAIVGNAFVDIWSEKEKVIFLDKLKEVFHDVGGVSEVAEVFSEMDTDESGTLDFNELRAALAKMNLALSMKDLRKLWATLDEDKSGVISCEEFCVMVLGEHYTPPGSETPRGTMRAPSPDNGLGGENLKRGSKDSVVKGLTGKQLLMNQQEIMVELLNLSKNVQNLERQFKKMAGGSEPSPAPEFASNGPYMGAPQNSQGFSGGADGRSPFHNQQTPNASPAPNRPNFPGGAPSQPRSVSNARSRSGSREGRPGGGGSPRPAGGFGGNGEPR